MVDRFKSRPLDLPGADQPFTRADLIFYGVDHSGGSYEGRVFLNAPQRLARDAGIEHPSYVGSFYVFGHIGCAGDVGHCDVPEDRDPFDLRLPHHQERGQQIVTVTEALVQVLATGATEARVTVNAHAYGQADDRLLAFTGLRLATYV